ncbi:polysaccharide pyruvyl transferase family protein [Maricaulis salignorans]|uniref:polysaccharide pyruvyl transferase family protein n=1 Tax=Maricaulis salignorans TaxID=144026 RepID=UPI003A902D17
MPMSTRSRLAIAAVMYSPNLGDGAIAACMDQAVRQHDPSTEPAWIDLAGRADIPRTYSPLRHNLLQLLDLLPRPVDQLAGEQIIRHQVRARLKPRLEHILPATSAILVGGGQLFSDAHMNFPVKLAELGTQAGARQIPMAIHGVGVAKNWRRRAAVLFSDLLDSSQLMSICVRDTASRDNLERLVKDHGLRRSTVDIRVAPDPAFMAAETFGLNAAGNETGRIGLGVTHPAALHAHGDYARVSERDAILSLAELASNLIACGFCPVLFTNGAFEDEAFLAKTLNATAFEALEGRVEVAPAPTSPRMLAQSIAGFDGVIAHRLHANILSYALGGVPVGLAWDAKMHGFFGLIGETGLLQQGASPDASRAVKSLQDGLKRRTDMRQRARELSQAARSGVLESLNSVC